MKKVISILCIVIMLFSLSSCSTSPIPASDEKKAEQKQYKFKMSGTSPIESETTRKVNEVLEKIKEETDGAVDIKFYPADQLGNYTVVYEEIMRGSIEMGLMSVPADFDQKLDMNHLPYLIENYDQARKVFSSGSFMFDAYEGVHKKLGVKLFGLYLEGFMGTALGKSLNKMPEDIWDPRITKDIQIRVPPSDVFRMIGESLGYRTTGIPWPDIYSSMQTGVVQGYIGAPALICYEAFRDVVRAFITNNYMVETQGILMNDELFESLPIEYQEVLSRNLSELAIWSIEYAQESDRKALELLRDFEIEVIEPTDEQLSIIGEHVRDKVWPSLYEIYGKELMDGIINDLK